MIRPAIILALAACASTAFASEPEAAPPPHAARPAIALTEGYEAIVLAPHRPIRIRMSFRANGEALTERWFAALRAVYRDFDRNGDGTLDGKEIPFIFSDASLAQLIQSGFYAPNPVNLPTMEKLDADRDGRISFAEFANYYQSSAARAVRMLPPSFASPLSEKTTEAVFKTLDGNGDGKLSRSEVEAVGTFLASHDADEDECLSLAELVPNYSRYVQAPAGAQAPQNVDVFPVGRIPEEVTARIVKQFDANGDSRLSLAESGFDAATFARLDADHDGTLSVRELDRWRTGPPDLAVRLSIAPKAADCRAIVETPAKIAAARGFTISTVAPGRLIVRHGRQPIELWAVETRGGRGSFLKQTYETMFKQLAGKKGYIEDADFTGPKVIQFQQIRVLLDPGDFNGDGKLTPAEFERYFELQEPFVDLGIALVPMVQTPTLFQLLDANRDGRLGVRELRTAWRRLAALEPPNRDGKPIEFVTRAAIMPTVSLRLSRAIDRGIVGQATGFENPNQVRVPQTGPLWFRKMDRNADGDLSPLEFLGARAEFEAIDADRDGLISQPEAEAYDKKMRKR